MSKRCTKCGTFLTETDRFCPNCGENAPQELENAPVYTSTSGSMHSSAPLPPPPPQYNPNQYAAPPAPPPYNPNAAPQYNPYQNAEEEMTVGKWLLTLFATSLGFIGIIFLFIWGFGSGPKSRQNFCKAVLIFYVIAIALVVVMFVFFIIIGVSFYDMVEYSDSYYYGTNMAKDIFGIFFRR